MFAVARGVSTALHVAMEHRGLSWTLPRGAAKQPNTPLFLFFLPFLPLLFFGNNEGLSWWVVNLFLRVFSVLMFRLVFH